MRRLAFFLFLLLSSPLFAQNPQRLSVSITPNAGYVKYVPFAPITLCTYNAQLQCNVPVTLYQDPGLTVPYTSQLFADAFGNFMYYVSPGRYVEKQCVPGGSCYYYQIYFLGSSGGGSGTVNPAPQYDVPWYSQPGTTSTLAGIGLNGIQVDSTTAQPRVALYTDVVSVFGGGACSGYLKSDGSCGTSATSVPFNDILAGTNTNPLVVGAGGSLGYSGGGTINASAFFGVAASGSPSSTSWVCIATTSSTCIWSQPTLDQIGPAFGILTFTCSTCTTVEIGATIASPTNFTASYTSLPFSASISDGTHSTTLTTPFTSGSLAFSYTSSTAACTTYTLTAIAATTKTASQQSCWVPRSFGGTGTGGSATSATASGNNAVLVGATGTLSVSYLGNSCAGQVYNVTTSGTQYVYLLLPCNVSNPTAGSFTTPGPTVFPMNTPTTITFTNQFSTSVTMYLYRSVNSFFTGSNSIITVGN